MSKTIGPYQLQKNYSVVTIPKEVRDKLDLKSGDNVMWVIDDQGNCILKKVELKF